MTRLKTPPAALISQYPVEHAVVKAGCGVLPKATIHHEKKSNGVMPARNSPMTRPLLEAVVKAAESQSALLKFVEEVALLKHEGEPGDDGDPFEPTSEDSIATLNLLILEARQLLDTADKCAQCGEVVPYVFGCPDGTELCQDCFDAGQH